MADRFDWVTEVQRGGRSIRLDCSGSVHEIDRGRYAIEDADCRADGAAFVPTMLEWETIEAAGYDALYRQLAETKRGAA